MTIYAVIKMEDNVCDNMIVGDVLPMHSHDENNFLISIEARGSFRLPWNPTAEW